RYEYLPLLLAGGYQVQWLTPSQKVQLRAHLSDRLTLALLDSSFGPLHALLEGYEERAFLDALSALRVQPWLRSLDGQVLLEQW
ncbi:molecular chaperone DnaJ, partial [Pseudomonas syringae pv. tagetis]